MEKVLVLGGNGFIGKNLSHALKKQGKQVTSFDLTIPMQQETGIEYVCGDFFDEETLEKYTEGVDIIYHGICTINPGNSVSEYMRGYTKDFIQTVKLCEIVKKKGIRMIFLSSGGTVYGKQEEMPISEECATAPINHYGNLKVCIENCIKIFNLQNGTNILIARIANPYGPGQDYEKGIGFVDAVLKRGIAGKSIEIWGDGSIVRDYIYIEDVVQMLCQLAEYRGKEQIFNLSTGVGKSQTEVVLAAKKLIPHLEVTYKPVRNVDVSEVILDNKKIKMIHTEHILTFEEGLEKYFYHLSKV